MQDTFADLASLLNGRSRLTKTVIAGDFNVDILRCHRSDPFASLPGREGHQADMRQLLDNFVRLYGLCVPPVDLALSSPGGPFSELCATSAITRLPVGGQLGNPSRLDFALTKQPKDVSLTHSWNGHLADHCIIIILKLHDTRMSCKKWTVATWHCSDEAAMRQAIDIEAPIVFTDVHHIHATCLSIQDTWSSRESANDRRSHRESTQVKKLRADLRYAATEADRQRFQCELYLGQRHIPCTLRRTSEITKFSMGCSIKRIVR